MGLRMSPAEMIIARVVSHIDYEREVLLALEEFGLFEFIDVTRQATVVEVKRSRDEETVFVADDRLAKVLVSLGMKPGRGTGIRVEIDDRTLSGSLKHATEVIGSVEPEVLEIDSETAAAQLELDKHKAIRDVAISLEPLGLDPSRIGATEYTFTVAGVVPTGRVSQLEWSLKEVTEEAYAFKHISLKRGVSVATASVPIERRDAVERILSAMEFESFTMPEAAQGEPHKVAEEAEKKITELEEELTQMEARKKAIAYEWGPRVLAAWETLEIEKQRIEVKKYLVYTEQSVKAWGWIPEGVEEEFESILREKTGAVVDIKFEHPDFAEYESPTYLDNPSVMKPTEDVVSAFGTPSRHDLDPTKVMWLSFPLIFGFVFADIGQGLLILLIGLAGWRAKRKGADWGEIMGYLQSGAEGLIMMGVFAIIGGFLFGSFFGAETVFEPLWPTFAHHIDDGHGHVISNPYRAAHMLKLSIEIGAIHIMLGILLNIYNKTKHHERREAVVGVSYLILYYGFINLLFGVSYSSVDAWFDSTGQVNLWVPIAGIGYGIGDNGVYPAIPVSPLIFTLVTFIIPFVIMALASFRGGMDGFVLFLEYGIGMISHTVSYARIFALNTVHVILSGVFFTLIPAVIYIPFPELNLFGIEFIPHEVHSSDPMAPHYAHLPLLGAIIGTFIVGILEGLLAFMHTLRLHFVEWFSKFFHAGGVAFMPFKARRLYTTPLGTAQIQESYAVS
ncbi:MAG: V-type ATP synthase subunit I [Candidatus Thorarchaeota archaeon]